VALVGSRRAEPGVFGHARHFARQLAERGLGVVSGAAEGMDQACHHGALDAAGETWAFMGAALDQLDPSQQRLVRPFRERGATFFSEYPPGARSSRSTFPTRNRLISGAADAVLIVRARANSGSLHTARAALEQGRPLLAWPAEPWAEGAQGSLALLSRGLARLCTGVTDVLAAVGLADQVGAPAASAEPGALEPLSGPATRLLTFITREGVGFDELAALDGREPGAVAATLTELELSGRVVQKPGRCYEKLQ
jgi:DNA processing protein